MGMSEFYSGALDEQAHINTLHAAADLGINHFDTADMYGVGQNVKLLSKAFSDRRDKLVIATKFGVQRGDNGEFLGLSSRPEYINEACDKSLARLGLDVIDLYYQLRPVSDTPIYESIGAIKELVPEGIVRYFGVSEFPLEQIRKANNFHPITAVQTENFLWSRNVEEEGVIQACRELGIAFCCILAFGQWAWRDEYSIEAR